VGVLRARTAAHDAVQQAYLRAFRRLADLQEPAAFDGIRKLDVALSREASVEARHQLKSLIGESEDPPLRHRKLL
jgi:hypothetical protein